MASALKNLSVYDESTMPDGAKFKIGIVLAEYHTDITHALYDGAIETLLKHGVIERNLHTVQVPGAFELPIGARLISGKQKLDAIICIGCVITGETPHNEYINQSVANALQTMSVASGRPYIFGLLTPNTLTIKRLARAGGEHGNKGVECATAALRMAALKAATTLSRKSASASESGQTVGGTVCTRRLPSGRTTADLRIWRLVGILRA